MSEEEIVTRFAPSPTGFVHMGNMRTCLFNYLFAKHNHGKCLLRIEDTDVKRSTPEAVRVVLDVMQWLGLGYDNEPVYQMQNIEQHRQVAEQLLAMGKAYRCYTSLAELEQLREEAKQRGEVYRFQSEWRDKTPADYPEQGDYVIRLKAPNTGIAEFHDLVQGTIKVPNEEIDDLIIMRSDGVPTYMLAVVVDDHNMGVNHVIRGDDHLVNTFKQILIYEAMGWKVPKFAHLPMIHAPEGGKLSKRHGAISVEVYKEQGYLPEAFLNCLMRLGWSHGDQEIISMAEAIEYFDITRVKKSPARFDQNKLDNLNKHYIKTYPLDKLIQNLDPNITSKFTADRLAKIVELIRGRSTTLRDLEKAIAVFQNDYQPVLDPAEIDKLTTTEAQTILRSILQYLESMDTWQKDNIGMGISQLATAQEWNTGKFAPLLRIALTYSEQSSGGIYDIMELLGKAQTVQRLQRVLQ